MKLQAFAVFDIKANSYITPFFLPNRDMAIRTFVDCSSDPEHQFCINCEDYLLHHVGEFDCDKGLFTSNDPNHTLLLTAIQARNIGLEKQKRLAGNQLNLTGVEA